MLTWALAVSNGILEEVFFCLSKPGIIKIQKSGSVWNITFEEERTVDFNCSALLEILQRRIKMLFFTCYKS